MRCKVASQIVDFSLPSLSFFFEHLSRNKRWLKWRKKSWTTNKIPQIPHRSFHRKQLAATAPPCELPNTLRQQYIERQRAGRSSDKRVINFNFPISSARRHSRISMFTARVAAARRRDSTLTYVTCNEERVTRSVPSAGRQITQAQGPSDVSVPSWYSCRRISSYKQEEKRLSRWFDAV